MRGEKTLRGENVLEMKFSLFGWAKKIGGREEKYVGLTFILSPPYMSRKLVMG